MEVESNVASLNETISRQESQVSVLQSDLNKARAECCALKESAIEMKEKAGIARWFQVKSLSCDERLQVWNDQRHRTVKIMSV